jgi:hypothetical protein
VTVHADDGCRLWTAATGHGPPLIMCHGGPVGHVRFPRRPLSARRRVRRLEPDIWRLYQYSARGAQNVGQKRHTLSEGEFRRLAEQAARGAAPVMTAPSSESQTAGCLNPVNPGQRANGAL